MSRLMHVTAGPYAPPAARRELVATSADGSRLHVEVHGEDGAPAVVLAHGWTCSTAFWAAQVRALSTEHRVIAYDQRGHGRSPAGSVSGYGTSALADDLVAVLGATLAPGEKAVIAGHSMGGMTIMAAAARPEFAEHAAAVLLCSTGSGRLVEESQVLPWRAGRARTRITGAVLGSRAPLGPVTAVARKVLKYATMGPGSAPDKVEACARIVHACPTAVRHAWSGVLASLDLDAQLAALTVPAAVIGGKSDRLTPIVHARGLAAALPNCVGLTELTGVGHMSPIEAPEAVTAAVRELAEVYLAADAAPAAPAAPAVPAQNSPKSSKSPKAPNHKPAKEKTP
ncbi:alpha/beta hydrolase [Streptomyces sp. NBC_00335]|uniref:alpha/beta fold hydrolase n=1 Tax=unclassified Streptomyces TaxID=2593676 RepID=UPI00225A5B65|nr:MULTISPECIES: alpha/beta hydrolase [unclassified Streptomyces]MCX5406733.1 alpha/beta hydrolase [Streptomyces sp. NBC_00086]